MRGSEELARLAIDQGVVRAAIDTGEPDTAIRLAWEHVNAEFQIDYGVLVAQLERLLENAQARLRVEQAELDRIDRQLAAEPLQIPASKLNGGIDGPGDPLVEVPPSQWLRADKIEGVFCLLSVIALWFACYFGIHATFANAQLPIFDDSPYLAFMLATLVPVAGLAVKLAGHVFDDPANRVRYRKAVVFAGIGAFFLWIPMFGALFEGLSGVFDPFKEANHLLGWAFNVGHIFAEVLIAAGIWAYLGAILNKYAPSELVDNPARPPLLRAQTLQIEVVEGWVREVGRIEGELARLYGIRDSARNLVETAIRQKMNEQPRVGLL